MEQWFWDEKARAFFDTASDAESLITRPREVTDNAIPSGTSLAVELLLKLAELDADDARRTRANWVLETLAEPMARFGSAFGHLLGAADLAVHGAVEVAIGGELDRDDTKALLAEVSRHYLPRLVLAAGNASVALMRDRQGASARAYVCRNHVCEAPSMDVMALKEALESNR